MSESLNAEQALTLVEQCPLPLLVLDGNAEVTAYNRSFAALVGKRLAADLLGRGHATLADHPLRPLTGTETSVVWVDRHGEAHHLEIQRLALPGDGGHEARFFRDISKLVELEQARTELNEQLKEHTLTDAATGLLNRRGVMLALEPQVARSRRYNSPMSVILLDVQADTERESLLVHVAQLLKDQLRWADLIGCTEQQEFILVLPETGPEAAGRLADKLNTRLSELAQQRLGGQSLWSCSGIAGWRRSDSASSLIKRAATALAQARSQHSADAVAL